MGGLGSAIKLKEVVPNPSMGFGERGERGEPGWLVLGLENAELGPVKCVNNGIVV